MRNRKTLKNCSQVPRPSLFFLLASNAFPDIGSVGRIEKKKNKNEKQKSQGGSE